MFGIADIVIRAIYLRRSLRVFLSHTRRLNLLGGSFDGLRTTQSELSVSEAMADKANNSGIGPLTDHSFERDRESH